jgi:putative transposase
MKKAFKYRLNPTSRQRQSLERQLEALRQLYNAAIQERRDAYKRCGKSINYHDQANQLKEIRQEHDQLREVNYSATQDCLRRLQKAFDGFFRRVKAGEKPGYPRFKGKRRYDSITFPSYGDGVRLKDSRLYAQNVGHIKIKRHRPIEGAVKTVTIKREGSKWYAVFTVEHEPAPKAKLTTGSVIGIDVNLENFLTTSDGEVVDNPRWFRCRQRMLARCGRQLSRKKRGSNRRQKAALRLQNWHVRIRNQRSDFHHKLSRRLVDENDAIFFEDLNIRRMMKNHHLAKSIADVGWGQFLSKVSYKAAEAGSVAFGVNPRMTTQPCSGCGAIVHKGLSQRWHACSECGLELPRDHNSALNILAVGLTVAAQGELALAGSLNCETSRDVIMATLDQRSCRVDATE